MHSLPARRAGVSRGNHRHPLNIPLFFIYNNISGVLAEPKGPTAIVAGGQPMLDLSNLSETLSLVVRLFFGVVAGVVGWFASAPLVSGLYAMAFQRKVHPW